MQPSNDIAQGSASLRQAFAAIGILVALAITVPLFGILMIPALAVGTVARALVDAVAEARWSGRYRLESPRRLATGSSHPAPTPSSRSSGGFGGLGREEVDLAT